MPGTTPRLVVAAVTAFLIILLVLVGTLDNLPAVWRGLAQGFGTVAGIYLGAHLGVGEDRGKQEAASRVAIGNLVALARSLQLVLLTTDEARARWSNRPPRDLTAAQSAADATLAAVDVQCRALLSQAEAAAEAWVPYVDPEWLRQQREANDS